MNQKLRIRYEGSINIMASAKVNSVCWIYCMRSLRRRNKMLSLNSITRRELWSVCNNHSACLTGALCQITRLYVCERERAWVFVCMCASYCFPPCEEILPSVQRTETGYGWRQETDGWHHRLAPSALHYHKARNWGLKNRRLVWESFVMYSSDKATQKNLKLDLHRLSSCTGIRTKPT